MDDSEHHFNGDLIDTIYKTKQHKPDTDQR